MTKYYFYIDKEGQQQGPLSLEQLIERGISSSTLVWHEGIDEWKAAILIEEVKALISPHETTEGHTITPPPIPTSYAEYQQFQRFQQYSAQPKEPIKPKRYFVESILVTLLCCLPFGIVALIFSLRVDDLWAAQKYDEAYQASSKAYLWVKISLFSIIIYPIIYIVTMLLAIPLVAYV